MHADDIWIWRCCVIYLLIYIITLPSLSNPKTFSRNFLKTFGSKLGEKRHPPLCPCSYTYYITIFFLIFRSFRLANKRPFSKLLIRDYGGCSEHNPGIGDISYVKDHLLGKIVSTHFRCSLFSAHVSEKIGWVSMNENSRLWPVRQKDFCSKVTYHSYSCTSQAIFSETTGFKRHQTLTPVKYV